MIGRSRFVLIIFCSFKLICVFQTVCQYNLLRKNFKLFFQNYATIVINISFDWKERLKFPKCYIQHYSYTYHFKNTFHIIFCCLLQKANEKLLFLQSSSTLCGIRAYLSQFQNLLYFKLSLTLLLLLLLLLLTKKQQQQKHLQENFRTRFKNHMISTA